VAAVRRHLIDRMTPEEIDALAAVSHRVVDHLSELPRTTGPP
jgi:hypothetical protein